MVPLNSIATSVMDSCRGMNTEFCFVYRCQSGKNKGKHMPLTKMNNTAWKRAWRKAGLPVGDVYLRGVHNLRHTFGRRLRAAGVLLETRRVLLGHTVGDITTHYSQVQLEELQEAVERLVEAPRTMLREVV